MTGTGKPRRWIDRRAARVAALVALSWLAAAAVGAQDAPSRGERATINYAFASQLGSGIYDVDGRTVQVYRLRLAHALREEGEGRWGLRLTFPVTFGLIDFRPRDLPQNGLPDDLDTVSFVPGAELRFLARPHWLVKPFAEAGLAKDRSGDADAFVFAGGVRTLADFHPGAVRVDLGNGLVYSRVEPREGDRGDDSMIFETSVSARRPLGFAIARQEADLGLYGVVSLYSDDPGFPLGTRGATSSAQYEVGLTFGTVDPITLWKIKLPRLGVGYRFGSELSSVRFVIGLPAPTLRR